MSVYLYETKGLFVTQAAKEAEAAKQKQETGGEEKKGTSAARFRYCKKPERKGMRKIQIFSLNLYLRE
jgi:hypothetical protein